MKQAYLFWYKSSQDAKTEYIYIIALSRKQACYIFTLKGYKRFYDYEEAPIDEVPLSKNANYEVGTILGQYAIL